MLVFSISFVSCAKVNPTAPDQSILYVSANPPSIPAGGATSTVTVIGYESTGIPLADGTVIYFTTDIGSIDSTAITKNGVARAIFTSDERSGVAHIYVTSGNVKADPYPLEIMVGSVALSLLTIGANPSVLPPGGGKSKIVAVAFDENGNTLSGIPVVFSTTAGSLNSGGKVLYTNQKGEVKDYLTTTTDATVTVTSGSVNASVTVTVMIETNNPPIASFVFSPTDPKVGTIVYFNASSSSDSDGYIVSYKWDFGDGNSGYGVQTSHTYSYTGTFQVTLVVRDDDGATGAVSQQVTVSEAEEPGK
jgi:hypothetical protein